MNSKKSRDIGMIILTAVISPGHVCFRDAAEAIANEHPFTCGTPRRLRRFAIGLRQLADAVDEQAVLVVKALAEVECAEPTLERTQEIPLKDDKQFEAAIQHFTNCLKQEIEPTAEETLSRNRTLLRGDSADIEGL